MSETVTTIEATAVAAPSLCEACPKPGICCNHFTLGGDEFLFSPDGWAEKVEASLKKLDLPFVLRGEMTRTMSVDGFVLVVPELGCNYVTFEGRCSIYEHRPDICSGFRPGEDSLCAFHKNHVQQGVEIRRRHPGLLNDPYFPIFPDNFPINRLTPQNAGEDECAEACKTPEEN